MLQIKNIEYGLIPTGPALGMTSLKISFSEDENEYEKDSFDIGEQWKNDKVSRMVEENPQLLFQEFVKKIQESDLEKYFDTAISGFHNCFLLFMGGEIDKPENFDEFNRFVIDLSNRAWNYQIKSGLTVDRLKPPYSIFVGIPKYMSGKKQFYQLFNSIYPLISFEKEMKFNALALQECFNGPFTTATIFCKDLEMENLNSFKKEFKIPERNIIIIPYNTSLIETEKELQKYVLTNNIRISPYMKGENYINFFN